MQHEPSLFRNAGRELSEPEQRSLGQPEHQFRAQSRHQQEFGHEQSECGSRSEQLCQFGQQRQFCSEFKHEQPECNDSVDLSQLKRSSRPNSDTEQQHELSNL